MIAAVDCETLGLDCTKFLQGCIVKENGSNKILYDKKEMWNYIKELGKSESKRGKLLNLYAHNHEYDFYTYADMTDSGITIHCTNPFIATYYDNDVNKETIKFLDTMGIYKMSLAKAAKIIGDEKLETPQMFIDGKDITKEKLIENEDYVKKDTELVLKLVNSIKEKNRKDGINPKRLYT